MSLIDLASMVLAPTAVKDGKVYNAIPNDQDFTFSRGTEATRVNSAGLIEKARTNFLLQSNTFDTTWTNVNTTETGGQTGYDESSDAWLLTKSAQSARIEQSISTSGVQTFSVYAKAGTLNWIRLNVYTAWAYYDLNNGVVGTDTNDIIQHNIYDVGNGWYRCELVINLSANILRIYPASGDGDVSGTSGNIVIQSAQLEQGLISTDIITTTTSSVTVGITDDLPRVDYSGGGCPSLLLEPSRTNEFTQSEYFADWNGYQETSNTTTAPDGSEVVFLDFEDRRMYPTTTILNATEYTSSIYLKANKAATVKIRNVASNDVSISLTTNWVRYDVTATSISTITNTLLIDARFSQGLGASGLEIAMYGAQVEQGSYASSYIPTYGTSTSRSADSCSLTNASNLIGQSEGTFYVETKSIANDSTFKQIAFDDGTTNNLITIDYTSSNNQLRSFIRDGGTAYSMTASITDSTAFNKIAIKAKDNDFAMWVNGTEVATSATATYPNNLDNIEFDNGSGGGLFYGNVKQMILFPNALTDTQLQELTK